MSDGHKNVCIMAWPAGHSRSPLIHNYWIKQHGLDAARPEVSGRSLKDLGGHRAFAWGIFLGHRGQESWLDRVGPRRGADGG